MMANKLFENAPGAINVKELKIDMMYIYGRVVPVSGTKIISTVSSFIFFLLFLPMLDVSLRFAEGSEIERNLFEGRDSLVDYVNNGCVPELNDVIPHTDPSEMPRRLRALTLFKTRGRQVGICLRGGYYCFEGEEKIIEFIRLRRIFDR